MMSGSNHEEILHRIVDGEARPEEVAALSDLLERDPGLRRRYERILALTSTLREVGAVEAPPEMRDQVLREIRRLTRPTRQVSWLETIRQGLRRRLVVREAVVFAGGMIVGALVLWGVRGNGDFLSHEGLTGTMVSPAADRSPLDQAPVRLDGVEGVVRTFTIEGGVQVEIELQAPQETLAVLGFDPRILELVSVHQALPTRGVEIHSDRVLVRQVGSNQIQILLRGDAAASGPLKVEVSSGAEWFEQTLASHSGRP